MARTARNCENTNIFHTIVRGNNNEEIFSDYEDKCKIVEIITEKSSGGAFDIIAYCILSNHAHFLIKENALSIAEAMKRINTTYAAYYNRKNSRYGHVFYSRYLSEGIADEEKLINAISYILNHAQSDDVENDEYALAANAEEIFARYYDYIRKCLGPDTDDAYFLSYITGCEYDSIMDLNNSGDDLTQAKALICKYFGADDITLQSLMQRECLALRAQMVLYLKQNTNLSIRKIAEVLNLNRGIVYKIICDNIKD